MRNILDLPAPRADVRIPWGRVASQFGDLRVPQVKGPHPAVVYFHGGYWRAEYDLTHAGHICGALTRAGFATWNVEYRRIGEAGGGWPGTLEDAQHGAQHLGKLAANYNLDLTRVVAAGHSAGGHLALWLAAQGALPLLGVISLAGICDLRRAWELKLSDTVVEKLMGGSPQEVPKHYAMASPIELLPIRVPQRLLHGTADGVVPIELSERFASASKDASLVKLSGAGHFELIDPRAKEWPSVLRSFAQW